MTLIHFLHLTTSIEKLSMINTKSRIIMLALSCITGYFHD